MPAYANKGGKVVCYFTAASKFKERYATFGFNATANLDEGAMWPTSFALKELTPAEQAKDRRVREEGGELSPAPEPGSPPRPASPIGTLRERAEGCGCGLSEPSGGWA